MPYMVYPERRQVSEEKIIGWAQDSLINAIITSKVYADSLEIDE